MISSEVAEKIGDYDKEIGIEATVIWMKSRSEGRDQRLRRLFFD